MARNDYVGTISSAQVICPNGQLAHPIGPLGVPEQSNRTFSRSDGGDCQLECAQTDRNVMLRGRSVSDAQPADRREVVVEDTGTAAHAR